MSKVHCLLVPTLNLEENKRRQVILKHDTQDLIEFACNSQNIALLYDSLDASATQNHIHAHLFILPHSNPATVFPVLNFQSDSNFIFPLQHGCTLSFLNEYYPGCAIKLSYESTNSNYDSDKLESSCVPTQSQEVLFQALFELIEALHTQKVPYSMMLFERGTTILYPRARQEFLKFPDLWLSGVHLSGRFFVESKQQFECTVQDIEEAIREATLPKQDVVERIIKPLLAKMREVPS